MPPIQRVGGVPLPGPSPAGTQWSARRYMNMDPLHAAKTEAYGAVVA